MPNPIETMERVAVLEAKVSTLEETIKGMDAKIDSLLAIKNKGAGAFWLASILFGTGIIGLATTILNWVKDHV
ncbi:MAG: hypothetical protein E6R03_10775 [Hyphomicrobiaceae bacterium]|nr:MAG: hypothetical protein E6R03_10775 [Hyphomicrobiaceae bacterium]